MGRRGAGLGLGENKRNEMRSGNMHVGYAGACSGRGVGAISFALSCPKFAILWRAQLGGHSSEMLDWLKIVYICVCVCV